MTYHVMLLDQAGLIEAQDLSSMDGAERAPKTITWAGHEFLNASRDKTRWEKAKQILKDKGVDLTFDVLVEAYAETVHNYLVAAEKIEQMKDARLASGTAGVESSGVSPDPRSF